MVVHACELTSRTNGQEGGSRTCCQQLTFSALKSQLLFYLCLPNAVRISLVANINLECLGKEIVVLVPLECPGKETKEMRQMKTTTLLILDVKHKAHDQTLYRERLNKEWLFQQRHLQYRMGLDAATWVNLRNIALTIIAR